MSGSPLVGPATAEAPISDALVIGGGPAGLALAAEFAARGARVSVLAPHLPSPFPATYGAWLDELPTHLGHPGTLTRQVWTDIRAYAGGPEPLPLLRPYALLDNAALLDTLLTRAGPGLSWQRGRAGRARRCGGARGGHWEVEVEGRPSPLRARLLIDASGAGGWARGLEYPGGPALQTAYGLVAEFRRPPIAPGSAVWMDYRTPAPALRRGPATFLYAMHLGGAHYFVEETSLIARPGVGRTELRARLLARLDAAGTPPGQVESEEWVSFPMNAAAPPPGPVLAYGAAGGLVHPVSGFQVAGALTQAPGVAQAALGAWDNDPAGAAWEALWPPERRAAREVHLLGVRALLGLPPRALPQFFRAFFELPPEQWQAFLAPQTPAGALARTMLRLFAGAPWGVRAPLARAALQEGPASLRALAAAAQPG